MKKANLGELLWGAAGTVRYRGRTPITAERCTSGWEYDNFLKVVKFMHSRLPLFGGCKPHAKLVGLKK